MLRRVRRAPWFGYLAALTVGVLAGWVAGSPLAAGLAALAFFFAWRAV